MPGALDGIKILELTRVGPGAFCTVMLADMGAEVLKIEPPPSGQLAGSGASPGPQEARKLATSFTNRNKKSLTLNLKDLAGQAVLQDLARGFDVLVEGFRPGVMKRLGGDYETLSKLSPRLIYCSLSGYGQDGPYRDFPAHDLNYLSLAGVANLIGPTEGPPAIPLNIVADYAGASMHGVTGIMFALFARERTGKGQFVDVSYLDTTISLLAATPNVRDYFADDVIPGRGKGGCVCRESLRCARGIRGPAGASSADGSGVGAPSGRESYSSRCGSKTVRHARLDPFVRAGLGPEHRGGAARPGL